MTSTSSIQIDVKLNETLRYLEFTLKNVHVHYLFKERLCGWAFRWEFDLEVCLE